MTYGPISGHGPGVGDPYFCGQICEEYHICLNGRGGLALALALHVPDVSLLLYAKQQNALCWFPWNNLQKGLK